MIAQKLYIDMDDVLCQYSKRYGAIKSSYIKYPQSQRYFFEFLDPVNNAIDAVNRLKEEYDVWILTAPSVYNPYSYTEKRLWIENHLGFDMCEKLILCPNKGLIAGHNIIDLEDDDYRSITHILIDDQLSGKGQEGFTGYLMQFGSTEFPDWETILDNLL